MHNPSIDGWQGLLEELNTETDDEIQHLTEMAERVADCFEGYWSLDFAMAEDGICYAIDMAPGEISWSPDKD